MAKNSPGWSYPSDSSDGDDTPGQQSKARAKAKPPVQPQSKPRSHLGDMRTATDSAGSDGSDSESTGTLDSHFARLAGSGGGRPPLGGLASRGLGRSNSRDVLLVARNAREQAKENDFLRRRVKELEEECGEHYEKVQATRKSQAETKTREGSLRGEAAAHEAAAEQLALELERMRDIESQSATEAMALVQKNEPASERAGGHGQEGVHRRGVTRGGTAGDGQGSGHRGARHAAAEDQP